MTRTTANIGQRVSYPKAMRVAVVKSHKKMSTSDVARDYNISKSTVNKWAKAAKKAKPQPTQLTAYQTMKASIKAANTPVVNTDAKGVTTITLNGKVYR